MLKKFCIMFFVSFILFFLLGKLLFGYEMGAGSGSSYPTTLDTDNTVEFSTDYAREQVPNDTNAAVVKIEAELGALPKGGYASVAARLNGISASTSTFVPLAGGTMTGNLIINAYLGIGTGTWATDGLRISKARIVDKSGLSIINDTDSSPAFLSLSRLSDRQEFYFWASSYLDIFPENKNTGTYRQDCLTISSIALVGIGIGADSDIDGTGRSMLRILNRNFISSNNDYGISFSSQNGTIYAYIKANGDMYAKAGTFTGTLTAPLISATTIAADALKPVLGTDINIPYNITMPNGKIFGNPAGNNIFYYDGAGWNFTSLGLFTCNKGFKSTSGDSSFISATISSLTTSVAVGGLPTIISRSADSSVVAGSGLGGQGANFGWGVWLNGVQQLEIENGGIGLNGKKSLTLAPGEIATDGPISGASITGSTITNTGASFSVGRTTVIVENGNMSVPCNTKLSMTITGDQTVMTSSTVAFARMNPGCTDYYGEWNATTSEFTARYSGLYYFSCNLTVAVSAGKTVEMTLTGIMNGLGSDLSARVYNADVLTLRTIPLNLSKIAYITAGNKVGVLISTDADPDNITIYSTTQWADFTVMRIP